MVLVGSFGHLITRSVEKASPFDISHFEMSEETYKYLGVLIGEDLTFDEHVNRVRGKLVSAAFMLNQSKSFLPFHSRLQVYRSIFESHLNFAAIV